MISTGGALLLSVVLTVGGDHAASDTLDLVYTVEPLTRRTQWLYPSDVYRIEEVVGQLRGAGIMKTGSRCDVVVPSATRDADRIVLTLSVVRDDGPCDRGPGPGWFVYRVALPCLEPGRYHVRLEQHGEEGWTQPDAVIRDVAVTITAPDGVSSTCERAPGPARSAARRSGAHFDSRAGGSRLPR